MGVLCQLLIYVERLCAGLSGAVPKALMENARVGGVVGDRLSA